MTISSLPLASTRIMAPSPPPAPGFRLSRGPPRVEAVLLGPGPTRLHATQRPWLRPSQKPWRDRPTPSPPATSTRRSPAAHLNISRRVAARADPGLGDRADGRRLGRRGALDVVSHQVLIEVVR